MDPATIDLLWEMHTELGSKEPIHVICGHRSEKTNNMLRRTVGGQAKQSQHISGKAIDAAFPDIPVKQMRYSALIRERGGVGYYPTSGIPFVHVIRARLPATSRSAVPNGDQGARKRRPHHATMRSHQTGWWLGRAFTTSATSRGGDRHAEASARPHLLPPPGRETSRPQWRRPVRRAEPRSSSPSRRTGRRPPRGKSGLRRRRQPHRARSTIATPPAEPPPTRRGLRQRAADEARRCAATPARDEAFGSLSPPLPSETARSGRAAPPQRAATMPACTGRQRRSSRGPPRGFVPAFPDRAVPH
jgi:hypothetical protein